MDLPTRNEDWKRYVSSNIYFFKNYYRSQSAAEYYSIGKRFNLRSQDHYLRVTLEKRIVTCADVLAYYSEHVQPTVKTQIRTS
jgi:hypothetical protein